MAQFNGKPAARKSELLPKERSKWKAAGSWPAAERIKSLRVTLEITTSSASPASAGTKCARCGHPFAPDNNYQRNCPQCRSEEPGRARERTRKWLLNRILRLTPAELEECRQDPRKVWTIRGPKWIACVLDGELHKGLGGHLHLHGLTAAAYKALPGSDGKTPRFSKSASLLSLDLQKGLSKSRKKLRLGRRLHERGNVPPVRKLIASRGSRVLSQQYRLEQSERATRARPWLWGRNKGKRLEKRTEDWQIAKFAAEGLSDTEIATQVGLAREAVGARRRRIGFRQGPKKPRVYRHGRPLFGRDLRAACEDLGLSDQAMADHMGLKVETVNFWLSPKRSDSPLSALVGRTFKSVYSNLREKYRHRPQDVRGGRPSLLLPNERAAVRGEYQKLLPEVRALGKWIERQRENGREATMAGAREFVYLQARKGRLRILALWPRFFEWLGAHKEVAALRNQKASVVVERFLGSVYGVGTETIRKAKNPVSNVTA